LPFVRFSRDKRGYEYIYLVHTPTGRGPAARPHVLYWYRTPPGVKVGREPFDDEVRRSLEERYPGIDFDWKKIREAQAPPPPEVEHWRERRRAERSAKQARSAAAAAEPAMAPLAPQDEEDAQAAVPEAGDSNHGAVPSQREGSPAAADQIRMRRRRRGGRRRKRQGETAPDRSGAQPAMAVGPADGPAQPSEDTGSHDLDPGSVAAEEADDEASPPDRSSKWPTDV
jgi:hypothetical protein